MNKDIEKILLTEEQIREKVNEIGKQISKDYAGKKLILISVLKGAVVFMADLMRAITIPCTIDFMAVSSYGGGTTSSGTVKILKDIDANLTGYDVLIVEDILDSGRTLSYLSNYLMGRGAKSIKIATFLDKPERRTVNIKADYSCFNVPNEFVVGYGLDFDQVYRNLPYVGILKPHIYNK